jgi:hypothetical protein
MNQLSSTQLGAVGGHGARTHTMGRSSQCWPAAHERRSLSHVRYALQRALPDSSLQNVLRAHRTRAQALVTSSSTQVGAVGAHGARTQTIERSSQWNPGAQAISAVAQVA